MPEYAFDNAWEHARHRLSLLEELQDPHTFRRLERIGVRAGWNCLEVGAGSGSVARWLADRVAPGGHVLGTDIDHNLITHIQHEHFEARQHDIVRDALPEATYDLIHARWVLMHIPERDQVLERLVRALKPGGWLFLEDAYEYPIRDLESPRGRGFHAWLRVVEGVGSSVTWAERLPQRLHALGLHGVTSEADMQVWCGGTRTCEFWRLSIQQVRDRIASKGGDTSVIDDGLAQFDDPALWTLNPITMAAWGRRPSA